MGICTICRKHQQGHGDLTDSYHEALEIRHRVRTELLEQTIVGLQNISLALGDFLWWSKTQGPISLTRVFQAVELLVDVVMDDVGDISEALDIYTRTYESKRAKAADDMFLQTTSTLETKLQLIYYRLQIQTGLNFDENFTIAFENEEQTVTYQSSYGGSWNGLDGDDHSMIYAMQEMMIDAQIAAQAVKGRIEQSTASTGSANKTYIPTIWHPGKEWLNPCNISIENLTQLKGSNVYKNFNNLYSINDAYSHAYDVFKLLMHLKRGKECRMLYRDNLEKAVKAVRATNASIYDFQQVIKDIIKSNARILT